MRAAIADYHRWGGRNGKHSVLTALGAGKSRVEEPADLVAAESPLPGLQVAAFLLRPHGRERGLGPSSAYSLPNPIMGLFPCDLI